MNLCFIDHINDHTPAEIVRYAVNQEDALADAHAGINFYKDYLRASLKLVPSDLLAFEAHLEKVKKETFSSQFPDEVDKRLAEIKAWNSKKPRL